MAVAWLDVADRVSVSVVLGMVMAAAYLLLSREILVPGGRFRDAVARIGELRRSNSELRKEIRTLNKERKSQ